MNEWLQPIFAPNGTRLTVNGRYANQFGGLLDDLTASGYGPDQNQSGGYNPRNIAGTNVVSQHASGRAIDVNWNDNPRGRQGRIDPQVARGLAQKHGMTWGGDWENPDPMHFEVSGKSPVLPKLELMDMETGANAREWKAAPMADYAWGESNPAEDEAWRRKRFSSGGNQSPMSDGTREDRQPSLMDQIAARTQNPLFQQGLGLFLAASQGKDLNDGLNAGTSRAKSMQDVMIRNLALQKQAAAQARIKEMMNNPAIMGQVPPALAEFVRATEDPSPIAQYAMRQPEAEMNRKRLDQQLRSADDKSKRDADIHPYLIDRHKAQAEADRARASHYMGRVQPVSGPPETIVGKRPDGSFYEIPAEMNAQMSGAPRVESRVLGDSTSVPATTQREHLDFGQYGMRAGNVPGIVTNQGGGSDRYATEVYQGQRAVSSMPDADRERYLEFERIQKRGHRLAGKPKQGFVYDKYLRQVPSGSQSASADAQERKDRAIGFMMDQVGEAEKVMIDSGNLTRSFAAGLKEGGIAGRMVSNTLGLEKVGAAFDKYKEGVMQTVYALSGKQTTNKEMQNFLDLFMPQAGESTWLIKDKTKRLNTMLSTLRSKVKTGMLFDDAMPDAIASAGAPGSGRGGGGQKRDLSKMSTDELLRSLNGR